MQEHLNANTLFATVAMYLGENKDLVLVVEGDDDHLTLKDHCGPDLRLIPGTGGKTQVLRTAELAIERGLDRARFLVDKDYDSFAEEPEGKLENVFYSKHHDCFMDLVVYDNSLVAKLIDVHTASARRRPGASHPIPNVENFYQEATDLASHLAAVRIVDRRMRLELDFKKFSFGGLKVRDFGARAVAEIMLSRSHNIKNELSEILDAVEATRQEIAQLEHPPFGDHDFFSALARVLRRHKIAVSDQELHRGFVLVVRCASIAETPWFREIQDWCASSDKSGFDCKSEVRLVA